MKADILIVEDEGLIALDLKGKLEQVGYRVAAIVDNSTDALRSVDRFRPSLVMMDIGLRGLHDGIATADEIRRRFYVPVVYLTASAERETFDRARITGPFDYIVKPFHGVDLRTRIETALRMHARQCEVWGVNPGSRNAFRRVSHALHE